MSSSLLFYHPMVVVFQGSQDACPFLVVPVQNGKLMSCFFFQCKYFTRLLNSESHIQIALSTVLLDLGVTVRNTGKFSGIFLCTILFPVKYSSRILKDSDSRPNSLLKFMSFLTGKLSNTMLAIQARCRGGTDSTL